MPLTTQATGGAMRSRPCRCNCSADQGWAVEGGWEGMICPRTTSLHSFRRYYAMCAARVERAMVQACRLVCSIA